MIDLENDGTRARVRVIPRLRIYVTRGEDDADTSVRPPARLFKPEEVGQYGGTVSTGSAGGRKYFTYDGQVFYL